MALITKGITMTWDETANSNKPSHTIMTALGKNDTAHYSDGVYTFYNLMEIGEINANPGAASSGYDQIEVTTLADSKHMFVNGLVANDAGSVNEITLKFLYEPKLFNLLNEIIIAEGIMEEDGVVDAASTYLIKIPNGGKFTVKGTFGNLKLDSATVNSALTFTVGLKVTDIEFNHLSV